MYLYEIATGKIYREDSGGMVYEGKGYSGFGSAKNDPTKVSIAGLGPLPPGAYRYGRFTDREGNLFVADLDPLGDVHGRSAFQWHGDTREHPGLASHGCLVSDRPIREKADLEPNRLLLVVSQLPRPLV